MEWMQVLTILGANVGTIIALIIWSRTEAAEDRRQIYGLIQAIGNEMKDFHGRLERQDAEFRTRFLAIEEAKAKTILEGLRAR